MADGEVGQVIHLVIPGWQPSVFYDVPWYSWVLDEVEAWADSSIVGGYGDGLFHPDFAVTTDQMAVFLIRALGAECANPCVDTTCWAYGPATPTTWAHDSADIPATRQDTCHGAHWAWFHLQALYETAVTLGCGDGTNCRPGDSVRRDQMAVFLARAFLGM